MSLVSAEHLSKTYQSGEVAVQAIKDANFTIEPASFVSFVGPSGSGKSTLLNMIGCLLLTKVSSFRKSLMSMIRNYLPPL